MNANRILVLLLAAGILIPASFILWFTNRAADREAESARREVGEIYRQQLRQEQDRIEQAWREREQALSKVHTLPEAVAAKLASTVIFLRADGTVEYPIALGPFSASPEPKGDVFTARDRIRSLVAQGYRDKALEVIDSYFLKGPGFEATDVQGRRIAGDELLLGAQIGDARHGYFLSKLTALLNDYTHNRMPSPQRLFLMDEAQKLGAPRFATFEAERLAARFLEADFPATYVLGLQTTNLAGVWKMRSRDGRVLALFEMTAVADVTTSAVLELHGPPLNVHPPGSSPGDLGAMMPGWQIEFRSDEAKRAEAESLRRRAVYLWIGYAGIAAVVLTGLLLAGVLRRQMQLARLKTDLASTVSHELKTPLASMRLLVDALLAEETPDPVKTREYLQLISGENQRLTRLVGNFLAFSRMERRRMQFTLARVRPEEIVSDALAATRERFEAAGGTITTEVEKDLPALQADPDALTAVLVNLLDNALKYSPDDKRAWLRASRDGRQVVFSVTDHGMGIAAKEQRRIFREFYQVDQSLARASSGCGLGLHIVEHIVTAHGGEVRVTSKVGKGSTFTVLLPEAA